MSIICPIDEHSCIRKECFNNPIRPICLDTAHYLAWVLGYTIKLQELLEPLAPSIDLMTEQTEIVKQSSALLHIEPDSLLDRVTDLIVGKPGSAY